MVPSRPRVLVVSFSDISRDARVLRQVAAVADRAEVTTVGFGPAPAASRAAHRAPARACAARPRGPDQSRPRSARGR